MSPASATQERPSLAELYEDVSRAENPELALLRLTLDRAARRHSELPAFIRLAAIPRRLDLDVIARLRGEATPGEQTRHLLGELAALPFMRSRQGGTWMLTDTVRELLLSEWRTTDELRSEFDRHNSTLFELFQARFAEVVEDERTLGMVSGLLRRVSPDRYGLLVAHLEGRQIAPLLEALYHETLRSPAAGFNFFSRSFQAHESAGRTAVCESLVRALHDFLSRLPEGSDVASIYPWLRYYEARLAARIGSHRKARLILEALREARGEDDKLQLWVLSELGALYQSTCHYRAARGILEEELEVAIASRVDPYNIPTSMLRLAGLHRGLSNLETAARRLRDAIAAAVAEGRSEIELSARIELSRVLLERGDVPGARAEAVRALDHARRDPVDLRHMQDTVADLFMTLQAHDDPALVDTLFQERMGLVAAIAEESAEANLHLETAVHLRSAGQFERALAVLEGPALAAGEEGRSTDTLYLLRVALTLEDLGRLEASAAAYDQLLAAARRRPAERFNAAAALSNRGAIQRDRDNCTAALQDFVVARKRWHRMGVAKLGGFVDVLIADTLLAAARRRALANPPDEVAAGSAEYTADVAMESAAWDVAAAACERALAQPGAEARPASSARLHGRLGVIAGARGRWADAAAHARAASRAWGAAGPESAAEDPPLAALPTESLALVREKIEAAERHVDFEVPPFQGELHHVKSLYHAACGEHRRSYAWLLLAVNQPEAISDRNALAGMHLELARAAGRLGQPADAATHAATATRIWQQLAANVAYHGSEQAARADDENDRGLRALTADVENRPGVVRAARDLFLAAAQRLPANWWYHLNLSYASAAVEDWTAAATALREALHHGPRWLEGTIVSLRLASYRIEHACALARTGAPAEAARALAESAALLARCDHVDLDLKLQLPEHWLRLGDGYGLVGQLGEATDCYQRALTMADALDAPVAGRAQLHARLALLGARQGRTADAAGRYRLAAELLRGTGHDTPYESLARELRPLIRTASDYDSYAEVLRYLSRNEEVDPAARRQIVRARLELNREGFHTTHFPREAAAETVAQSALPVVTPTALNGHPDLFPEGEDWADDHPLFTSYIPAMRTRITADLGVRVPGIRVRADADLAPKAYALQLDEVPVTGGNVEPGGWFCPEPGAGARALGRELTGSTALDPRTGGMTGLWLDATSIDAARTAHLELWDHHEYMIRHLERLQREHITLYVGLQELEALLTEWQAGRTDDAAAEAQTLITSALPDLTARLRYLQVLHGLLREGVSIADQAALLRAFAAHRGEADVVRNSIESARAALRDQLPGNRLAQVVLRCSPAFETAVARGCVERGRVRLLALTPEVTNSLVSGIREAMAGREQRDVAVVVSSPGLRPFVRYLVEAEFAHAHVLGEPELAEQLRDRRDGAVEVATT